MPNALELEGQVFGRLTVIRRSGTRHGQSTWLCKCECGEHIDTHAGSLKRGSTKSCGCLHQEIRRTCTRKHGHTIGKHTKEYAAWATAKNRCKNATHPSYKNYGGRGISMCDRWANDFRCFLEDMGTAPEGLSLDRIDNNGNYEPGNCRWTDARTQLNNSRRNIVVEWEGETMTLTELARRFGIKPASLNAAYWRRGTPLKEAVERLAKKRSH